MLTFIKLLDKPIASSSQLFHDDEPQNNEHLDCKYIHRTT